MLRDSWNESIPPVERVLQILQERGCSPKRSGNRQWVAQCPAHADRQPSLSLGEGEDGRALLHCHAGCSVESVVLALGLRPSDLFPTTNGSATARNGVSQALVTHDDLLSTALRYAELGYRVFPCARGGKAPLTGHGFRDATNDPKQIEHWWDMHPEANIGLVTEGLVIIDADGEGNPWPGDPERAADLAGAGAIALTPRGGRHYFFRQPEGRHWRCTAGRLAPCVDTRGFGGYVLVPPSRTEYGHYRWASDLALDVPPDRLPEPPSWLVEQLDRLADGQAKDTREAEAGGIPESRRNNTLTSIAGTMRRHGIPEAQIAEALLQVNQICCQPALPQDEVRRIAKSVGRYEPAQLELPQYRPFPTETLPSPIKEFVADGSAVIGCDPVFLALPLLVAAGSAIGNARRLELKKGWLVPPVIWGCVIGESGTAKSPAFRLALRPVYERQRKALERHTEEMRKYRAELLRWERDIAAWKKKGGGLPPAEPEKPRAERCVVSDATVESLAPILLDNPRGLLLARDELAGWIGSFDRYAKARQGADVAAWLSMYNGEALIVDRKTGDARTVFIPSAAVSLCGGIQPGILQRALTTEYRESGLAARLLLTYPPRQAKRWTEADIDPGVEAEVARLVDRLYELQPGIGNNGEPRPLVVHLTDEAKAAWIAYYNEHNQEQVCLVGDMASAWSKLEETAARLALVIHYARWAAGEVTDETQLDVVSVQAGITLANWFKHEARRVYAMLDETDGERDQRRLIEWIKRKGGSVTVREVQMGCRWLRESGLAEAALDQLVKAGLGSWRDIPPTAKGGRPVRTFYLCQHVNMSTKPPEE